MKRASFLLSALLCLVAGFSLASKPKYPLRFQENKGQYNIDILYVADIPSGKMYLKKDRIIFQIVDYGYRVDGHLHPDNEIINPDAVTGIWF